MTEITPTGKGLGILIDCDPVPSHNWMSFAAWYSIFKVLPDAKSIVSVKRGVTNDQICRWCYKVGTQYFQYGKRTDPIAMAVSEMSRREEEWPDVVIKITPDVMAVREYGKIVGPVPAKSNKEATFVSYSQGCGKFLLSDWLNKSDVPFAMATAMFSTHDINVNELKVLKLWGQANSLYIAI